MDSWLRRLSALALLLAALSSSAGVFLWTEGAGRPFVNQYGDEMILCGRGVYKADSAFSAPIFRGTDAVILFVVVPVFALALLFDVRKGRASDRVFLASTLAVVLYYAASLVFGVAYNALQIVYIALFSASLFGFVSALVSLRSRLGTAALSAPSLPRKGVSVFLCLSGAALFLAWVPDLAISLASGRPPAIIANYSVIPTYALDMGVLAPFVFVTLALIRRRAPMGYAFLACVLSLCVTVGIMMPAQTVFQARAGIALPAAQMITKSGTFVVLALAAAWLEVRLFRALRSNLDSSGPFTA